MHIHPEHWLQLQHDPVLVKISSAAVFPDGLFAVEMLASVCFKVVPSIVDIHITDCAQISTTPLPGNLGAVFPSLGSFVTSPTILFLGEPTRIVVISHRKVGSMAWIMGYIGHFDGRLKNDSLYVGRVESKWAKPGEPIDEEDVKSRAKSFEVLRSRFWSWFLIRTGPLGTVV